MIVLDVRGHVFISLSFWEMIMLCEQPDAWIPRSIFPKYDEINQDKIYILFFFFIFPIFSFSHWQFSSNFYPELGNNDTTMTIFSYRNLFSGNKITIFW